MSTIRHGTQGSVKLLFDKHDNRHQAVKIYKKRKMDAFNLDAAYFEKSLMDQLGKHDNILNCESFYEDSDYILFIMDLMDKDMRDVINDMNVPL